ncbi:uncharacterized protein LOC111103576 [Crassostrea virginica]
MEFVFFLLFICTFKRFFCQDCRGNDGTVVCCGGYHWNSTLQSCQPCRIGFNGPNCSDACVYPGYGKDCQMECNCTKSLCSHIDGCNTSNEELLTNISYRSIPPATSSTDASRSTQQQNCTKRKVVNKNAFGVYTSVICLTAISGVFLLLYIGLHCYMKRFQINNLALDASQI